MQKADLTPRVIAGFIDLLIVIGLSRLPDSIGFLSATGYILVRDGLFRSQSLGKKVIGLRVGPADLPAQATSFRESVMRNATLAAAFMLFQIPYAGWVLGPAAICIEGLTAVGDDRGMRIGDLIARTVTVAEAPVPSPAALRHQPDFGALQNADRFRDDD